MRTEEIIDQRLKHLERLVGEMRAELALRTKPEPGEILMFGVPQGKHVAINKAIEAILDHLGMELEYDAGRPPSFKLKEPLA